MPNTEDPNRYDSACSSSTGLAASSSFFLGAPNGVNPGIFNLTF